MKTHIESNLLHVAVQFNKEVCVEEICRRCPSLLLQQNLEGDTPLHIAARMGLSDVVRVLFNSARQMNGEDDVEKGIGLELLGEESTRFFSSVAEVNEGYSSSVSMTKLQQLVRLTNNKKDTALHEALRNPSYGETVKLLAEADPSFAYCGNNAGETPLHLAVQHGEYFQVKFILNNLPIPSCSSPGGRTVLHNAILRHVDSGLMDIVDVLLENKRHLVKEADRDGRSALHYAAYDGNAELATKLLDVDPSAGYIKDKDGMTALHHAAGGNDNSTLHRRSDKFIENVIQRCPDSWELLDSEGRNFLHVAAKNRRFSTIKYVFDMKSNYMANNLICGRDKHGNTPWDLFVKSRGGVSHWRKDACYNIFLQDPRVIKVVGYKYRFMVDRVATHDSTRTQNTSKEKDKELSNDDKIPKQKEKTREKLENMSQSHMVVVTLIATVAFAAGFTLPGGYRNDGPEEGMATLAKKSAFIAFMVSNSLAMLLSLYALFIHFWTRFQTAMLNKYELISVAVPTLACTFFAILAMAVAFVTGTYTVISCFPGLAIPLCVLSCSFFVFAFNFLYMSYRWLDEEDRIPFLKFAITRVTRAFFFHS
ncbi:hypothetical protein C5167_030048 [Papaver somniferum]|uniref:protein ACCELERATED CELL DEATH 6-like n=1 Tax=Papaver somniferum TaxID=3469 RepID=UPI000E6FE356|nr:protein ACCELERATED CELL DEATH 6-like [Papaver somniferum]RZC86698.1 hypothetical protein C5167_030048 [Papaver somniferum]